MAVTQTPETHEDHHMQEHPVQVGVGAARAPICAKIFGTARSDLKATFCSMSVYCHQLSHLPA